MGKALVIMGANFSSVALDSISVGGGGSSSGGGTSTTYYYVTLTSNQPSYGSVYGSGSYSAGSEITISAVPKSGYRFVSWSDGRTESSRIVAVTSNFSLSATFEAISTSGGDTTNEVHFGIENVIVAKEEVFLDPDNSINAEISNTSSKQYCYTAPINVEGFKQFKINWVPAYVAIAYSDTTAAVNTSVGVTGAIQKVNAINREELNGTQPSQSIYGYFTVPAGSKTIRVNIPLAGKSTWEITLIR